MEHSDYEGESSFFNSGGRRVSGRHQENLTDRSSADAITGLVSGIREAVEADEALSQSQKPKVKRKKSATRVAKILASSPSQPIPKVSSATRIPSSKRILDLEVDDHDLDIPGRAGDGHNLDFSRLPTTKRARVQAYVTAGGLTSDDSHETDGEAATVDVPVAVKAGGDPPSGVGLDIRQMLELLIPKVMEGVLPGLLKNYAMGAADGAPLRDTSLPTGSAVNPPPLIVKAPPSLVKAPHVAASLPSLFDRPEFKTPLESGPSDGLGGVIPSWAASGSLVTAVIPRDVSMNLEIRNALAGMTRA
ncbi:hypothetical protein HDU67_007882 [Dinochytrium kinnereticum]|nr:hypothetical protein HDU67_007882 [Dinochytrium kinnereticum]